MDAIQHAKEVFAIESQTIAHLSEQLTEDFAQAVDFMRQGRGKVIVSGMGKSGLIGKKIAATLSSTGTPSFFMHPGEAYHGDLGMIAAADVVLIISYSGETDEVLRLIPFLKDNQNIIIAMTGNPRSTLSQCAHAHLNIAVEKEACPFNLAPTSSTVAALAMGDALVVALMKQQGFGSEHFARFHPGGSLGKRLVTQVSEVMRQESLPTVAPDTNVKEIIHTISAHRLGLAIVLDQQQIQRVITDGDIRRAMEDNEDTFFTLTARNFPPQEPKTVAPSEKLVAAERLMNQYKINTLLVVEKQQLQGVIQIYDII